jgi:putative hydrolase of the HAD superfamily
MRNVLLLDFDQTLAYRDGMFTQTLADLLEEYGRGDIGPERIRPYMRQGFPWHTPEITGEEFFRGVPWWDHMTNHFRSILIRLEIDEAMSGEIASRFRDRYLDPEKWHLYDDTVLFLKQAVESGHECQIVSNHVPELPELVDRLEIGSYFTAVHSSANVGYEKPHPAIFQFVLDRLGEEREVTMIGDNYAADILGARNAGIRAIFVRSENQERYPLHSETLEGAMKLLLSLDGS